MAILNNVEHADLQYQPLFGTEFGDAVNRMELFVGEFAEAQRSHPILFAPDAEGRLMALALLGFEKGENLHLETSGWGSAYVPAARRRGPFSVSVRTDSAGQEVEMLIDVDLNDRRIGTDDGISLFKPHGGNSALLDMISDALVTIYDGTKQTPAFIDALMQYDLLREVQMDIDLGNGQSFAISGHLVVDEARFAALDGSALKSLSDAGFLVPLVHAMTSVTNIQQLVDRKVAKLSHVT